MGVAGGLPVFFVASGGGGNPGCFWDARAGGGVPQGWGGGGRWCGVFGGCFFLVPGGCCLWLVVVGGGVGVGGVFCVGAGWVRWGSFSVYRGEVTPRLCH